MKELKRIAGCLAVVLGMLLVGLVFTGCQVPAVYTDYNDGTPATTVHVGATAYQQPAGTSDVLIIGDSITITFNSGDTQPLPVHSETIKDDGRITPPYVGSIIANNKSPGALQAELQELYNKLYRNMTVTVTSPQRYYSVSGEVKNAGQKLYLGKTDLVSAISSASDFTEFANKRQIRINRANGKTETVDYNQAIDDPRQNVPIYPGDTILVPRRYF